MAEKKMNIVCLDMEGVLVPEIWIAFAEETGIPEFKKTTRDEPDYDKLMEYRINLLKEHGLGLKEIQETIAKIDPLPGAKEFLDKLRQQTQVIIRVKTQVTRISIIAVDAIAIETPTARASMLVAAAEMMIFLAPSRLTFSSFPEKASQIILSPTYTSKATPMKAATFCKCP